MVLHRPDTTTERDAEHDRQPHLRLRPVTHLGDLRHQLVVRRIDEAVELDLAHRAVATDGQTDSRTHDAGLGQRGVDHPFLAEVLLQSIGDTEDTAELPDVLTHDDDLRVDLHRPAQAGVERSPRARVSRPSAFTPLNEAR